MVTVSDRIAALPQGVKRQFVQAALDGDSITNMSERFRLEYAVVQAYLWQEGTLPWQGAKTIISRRLRSLRSATRRPDRDRLVDEIAEQVDYLYYAARQLHAQLEKVKKSLV